MDNMSPSKPYMIRAIWEWVIDNELTPHIMVDALYPGTLVPQQFVKDGQIVLNVAPATVVSLDLDNAGIIFNARFSGIAHDIYVPVGAVLGIYARENGRGMMFEPEDYPEYQSDIDSAEVDHDHSDQGRESSVVSLVDEDMSNDDDPEPPTTPTTPPTTPSGGDKPPKKGRPALRVVK